MKNLRLKKEFIGKTITRKHPRIGYIHFHSNTKESRFQFFFENGFEDIFETEGKSKPKKEEAVEEVVEVNEEENTETNKPVEELTLKELRKAFPNIEAKTKKAFLEELNS